MTENTTRFAIVAACLAFTLLSPGCNDDECANDDACNDGVFCNGDEVCVHGECLSAGLRDCNDGLACTADSCNEALGQCDHLAEDIDGDGHFDPECAGDDCDDSNPAIHPGAEELCDGFDNDCNDIVEEDSDGDGHLDLIMCEEGDDCDDTDPAVYPGAEEICDGIDNNCSGDTDDEADTDGDSHEDPTCGGDDCDDEDPDVYPGATEICNGRDDDCDEAPDEDFECIRRELYTCETTCFTIGTIECDGDCTFPDPDECEPPEEACNGIDDDCDGVVDNDLPCAAGDLADCTTSCGSLGTGTCTAECLPAAPADCIAPPETCNGIDDNCNGTADEGFYCAAGEESRCITECDSEGRGPCTDSCEPAAVEDCVIPDEVCNDGVDNDCDLDIDCFDEDCLLDPSCGV